MLATLIHYFLHLLFPGILARIFWSKIWKNAWLILLSTMLVDLDHLLASPIFDPNRCSINFHPLHSYYAFPIYVILFLLPKTRLIGLGLSLHMLTDGLDCFLQGL
ncbi:DUF6122 family protein [Luteibaculum oceani]|uniref:Metal-dependent hydrolase n=1 Tax=Luteibaculum oceani TaxID=1294296 RepID=A0A5C6UZW0_9FLAO|nr:DUF6122 family protein [Luteibaculum oceani]TXC76195.1 hypothetical protein FRX97_10615 [Luteibaculum oceani]